MKTNKLFLIAALLGTVLAGCQKEHELIQDEISDSQPQTERYLTLKVVASKTKALSLSGGVLNPYWRKGETVAAYYSGQKIGTLEVTSDTDPSPSADATLSGKIKMVSGIGTGSTIYLLFPGREDEEWTYQGQDGTAPSEISSMALGFDYATATLTLGSVSGDTVEVSGDVSFTTEQSVFRFAFKVGDNVIPVSTFTLSSEQNKIVRNRSAVSNGWSSEGGFGSLTVTPGSIPGNLYYLAVRNEHISSDDTFYFSVTGSDKKLYLGSKTIPLASGALDNGHYVGATIKLTTADMSESVSNNTTTVSEAL